MTKAAPKAEEEAPMHDSYARREYVTVSEIQTAIDQCNFNKGIGPDGFDGRIFERDPSIREFISEEIKDTLNRGEISNHLKIARLVPLTKIKGRSVASVEEIRPIMIKSHLFKIIEKVVLNKIKSTRSTLLHSGDYQNGFKEQRSTCNNLA